jgi:alpha-L-rhamnosidase
LRSTRDWSANWIWYPEEKTQPNTCLYFRKTFRVESDVESAVVYVSADTRYRLYVNGQHVGRGPAPTDPRHPEYDEHDVTPLLTSGTNVFALLVYCYAQPANTYVPPDSPLGTGGLILEAELQRDGGISRISTDASWRVLRSQAWPLASARLSRWRSFVELFDARAEPDAWTKPEFEDGDWKRPLILDCPRGVSRSLGGVLVARDIPALRDELIPAVRLESLYVLRWQVDPLVYYRTGERDAYEVLPSTEGSVVCRERTVTAGDSLQWQTNSPISVRPSGQRQWATLLFDMGHYVAGRVRLEVRAGAGTCIDVLLSEVLPEARPIELNVVTGNWMRFICREGHNVFESIDVVACRYLQLAIHSTEPALLLWAGMNEQSYEAERVGSFACSDSILDDLYEAGARTMRACMHDIIVDNVWREYQNWGGDIDYAKLPMYCAYGAYPLARRTLRLQAQSQTASGRMISAWPSSVPYMRAREWLYKHPERGFGPELPSHSFRWVNNLWHYYLHSGDREFIVETYPAVRRLWHWTRSHQDATGLMTKDRWDFAWFWVDHTGLPADREPFVAMNLLYVGMLTDVARLAAIVGAEDDRADANAESDRLRVELRSRYWDAETRLFFDAPGDGTSPPHWSEHTIALSLLHRLVPDSDRSVSAAALAGEGPAIGRGTPVFKYFVHWALSSAGRRDAILDELKQLWARQTSLSETGTFAEYFDPTESGYLSFCQSACAVPTYTLTTEILGIRPVAPGFSEFRVDPYPGHLTWARGSMPTPAGPIRVQWEATGGRITSLEVEAPPGCRQTE